MCHLLRLCEIAECSHIKAMCYLIKVCLTAEYSHNKQNAAMMRGLDAIGIKSGNMPR